MPLTKKQEEQLKYFYFLSRKSKIVYWAEKTLNWSVLRNEETGKEAWLQYVLLGCFDNLYKYPEDYRDVNLRGKLINKFAWRVGRQFGKTNTLATGGLYLALKRPIKWTKPRRYKDHSLIGTLKPDGTINETGWTDTLDVYWRGAKIIVGSADADKARTIFDRVMKYINQSEKLSLALENKIIEKKLHPFPELIFHVEGWTEPASITFRGPGAGGQTARSKTFDYKIYDEADYMPEIFFEAEKATSINAGDNGLVILSSTPTGKRAHFYNACFTAGNCVVMENETLKPIENVEIGDIVYNRYGKLEPVTKIMNREYKGKLISFLTTLNNTITTCTKTHRFMSLMKKDRFCKGCEKYIWDNNELCPIYGNHSFLPKIKAKYNKITDLKVGDFLAIPLPLVKNLTIKNSYKVGKFLYVPIIDYIIENKTEIVYNLTVGEDHSYCVNYYGVANCTNPDLNYLEFHIPSKENPNYTVQFDKEFLKEHPRSVYEHEINADWGTVEEGVFDWTYFEWVFRMYEDVPTKDGKSIMQKPIYRIFNTESHKKRKPYPDEYEKISLTAEDIKKIGHINLGIWIKSRIPPKDNGKRYWFGADLGYQSDPSEFFVFQEYNGIMKLILRIHMEHVSYLTQCDIIALLDNNYMFEALGIDQGGNGIMVEQTLKAKDNGYNKYKNHNFEKRLHAINFSKTVEVSEKFSGKTVLVPVKQFMTDSIILAAQNKMLIMPSVDIDDEIENQFRNHTYSVGSGGMIIYSKSNVYPEHCIDAVRCCYYAKAMVKMPRNRVWPTGGSFRAGGGSSAWR